MITSKGDIDAKTLEGTQSVVTVSSIVWYLPVMSDCGTGYRYQVTYKSSAVFRIHDILVWIRIRIPRINASD
jgi:hypothetical protein